MDELISKYFGDLHSEDADVRYEAFQYIIKETHERVSWAYEVWDDMVGMLTSKNNHQRSIAAQVLSNLAKSDPEGRMLKTLDDLMLVTKDEKFVTARHALQSLWKVGAAGKTLQAEVVKRLTERFRDCHTEKNDTLIRYDIIEVLRKLYSAVSDPAVKDKALELIATEKDEKYRKKYMTVWKDIIKKDKNED